MLVQKFWNKLTEPRAFNSGYLPPADGHQVYFAEYGNPEGIPVISTHGGPGGCVRAQRAKLFNLKKYRVILFDQRGCGQSLPFGELRHNTTEDILNDMRRLLEHLKIKSKIILYGGSWASTLMLLFAERNPDKIEKMILTQIFLADGRNEKWLNEQSALFYPDILERLRQSAKGKRNLNEYYLRLLKSKNPENIKNALGTYGVFERQIGSLRPQFSDIREIDETDLAYLRIYAQFAATSFGIKNNEILLNIKKIKHIPSLIIHNRLDMVCPLLGAYELSQKMENARLVIVPERGHCGPLLNKILRRELKTFL